MFQAMQPNDVSFSVMSENVASNRHAVLPTSASLVTLGADLQACLEQPDNVSIGEFAALVERLHGEFRMLCGDDVSQPAADEYSGLFIDSQTREFSQSDVGQIESVLRNLG
jgi:hypothetical protein